MGAEELFQHVYSLVLFFSALWVVGKLSAKLGLPSLVGEIVTGIVLGPNLLDFVPKDDALIVIGDIGLLLLVLEAGIDVNMGVLKVVGTRGLMIAIFGSLFPLFIGSFIAYLLTPTIEITEAIAIGACFAPTSMGIALNVLRNGGALNTPTGQLIIAAAVLDDVVALMLLSVLQEMAKGSTSIMGILIPVMVSPVLMLVFGFIAVKVSPQIIKFIMDKLDIIYHEYAILLMLFSSMLVLVPACFYAKSSYLLGAFLAGLMFCTDHTIHHVWEKQMQKLMHWFLRIFFACTIGFIVPIRDFLDPQILIRSLIYFTAIIGKLCTGFFATSKPIRINEFFTIGFSMSAWGEFAFILATSAYNDGIFGHDTLSEILLAVLLSVIISPLLLRITLIHTQKKKVATLKQTRNNASNAQRLTKDIKQNLSLNASIQEDGLDESTLRSNYSTESIAAYTHFVYYCIRTKAYGNWGHQDRLLKCLYALKLEMIDFRVFNGAEDNFSHHTPCVEDVFYVKDTKLSLLPTKQLNAMDQRKLSKRVNIIKRRIKQSLQDKRSKIEIMRWLPGIKKTEDIGVDPDDKQWRVTVSYVRDEAYKQARMALSYSHLQPWKGPNQLDIDKHDDDGIMRTPSSRIQRLKRTVTPSPGMLHTPLSYLSRIHSDADVFSKGTTLIHPETEVHNEMHDDLIKLKLADSAMDLKCKLSTDEESIQLNIIYGDEDANGQPLDKDKNKYFLKIPTAANHKTPLLKRKKKFPKTP